MNVQWYPGHMTRAVRQMKEEMGLVDLVIELVDARIPYSSRNPDIDELAGSKYRLIIMAKTDLADPARTEAWKQYFLQQGCSVVALDARTRGGMKTMEGVIMETCREKLERDRRRGIKNRPIRAMVAGIPNVGKSTLINSYAGRSCVKTGNKPGVTRGKQWIRLGKGLELLDTPGILWPRFEDQKVGMRLAMVGSIRDEVFDREQIAMELVRELKSAFPGLLQDRYRVSEELTDAEVIAGVAANRGCLLKGGEADHSKAAGLILDDFRSGRLGRITLEEPPRAKESGAAEAERDGKS